MPGFDGTGPSGQGPMTGQGRGFCVLRISKEKPGEFEGLAGLQSAPVHRQVEKLNDVGKEVVNMPLGDGTSPVGSGPMISRGASLSVSGYAKPVAGRAGFYGPGVPVVGPFGPGLYGYRLPYGVRVTSWFRRAFGFGRGFGRGRGRGRGLGRGRGRFVSWL
jgi:hypothetical protein